MLGLGVALLLGKIRALQGLFRALYFAPYVTPIVAAAWVWQWLFSPQFGPVNTFLIWLHIPPQNFLTSPSQALATTTALIVWQNLGFQVVLFLAGLAAIPAPFTKRLRSTARRAAPPSGRSPCRCSTPPLFSAS